MFRSLKLSDMDPHNFSVGSIIQAGESEQYLVVSYAGQSMSPSNIIGLLDLQTFVLKPNSVKVQDQHHLTEGEARELASLLDGTFSDFDCKPQGLKK